ncbi:histone acetyltransferase p300-like isoform X2 [Saccopteryx bilineata]|uniref:histone acetyltransferase p300-like isoform X2 n=1 Tax=Saccopteryx bilineata TaxID=59482 RepID=UPI00338F9A56
MENGGPGLDEESSNPQAAVTQSLGDTRHMSYQRCMLELIHACQCKDVDCSFDECQKMKRVVEHTKHCQRKASGSCPICKELIAVCCHHAKHCQQNICSAPFCHNIKEKLKRQQQQQEMQDEMEEVQEGSVGQMDQLPQVLEAEAGASQQAQPE